MRRASALPDCTCVGGRVCAPWRVLASQTLLPSTAPAERVADTSIRLVVVSAAAEDSAPQIQSYLFRVKTAHEAESLLARINANIPPAEAS